MYTYDTIRCVKYDNVAFGEEREWKIERNNNHILNPEIFHTLQPDLNFKKHLILLKVTPKTNKKPRKGPGPLVYNAHQTKPRYPLISP